VIDRLTRMLLAGVLVLLAAIFAQPYINESLFSSRSPRPIEARGSLAEAERTTIAIFGDGADQRRERDEARLTRPDDGAQPPRYLQLAGNPVDQDGNSVRYRTADRRMITERDSQNERSAPRPRAKGPRAPVLDGCAQCVMTCDAGREDVAVLALRIEGEHRGAVGLVAPGGIIVKQHGGSIEVDTQPGVPGFLARLSSPRRMPRHRPQKDADASVRGTGEGHL
jgi:hypothetical protein